MWKPPGPKTTLVLCRKSGDRFVAFPIADPTSKGQVCHFPRCNQNLLFSAFHSWVWAPGGREGLLSFHLQLDSHETRLLRCAAPIAGVIRCVSKENPAYGCAEIHVV